MPRWKWLDGNLVDMVAARWGVADDLGHPIQAIGIGQHLAITADNPEEAHGLGSMLAINPGNQSLLGDKPLHLFGQPIASRGYPAPGDARPASVSWDIS
jgi:hypothetical protein